MSNDRMGLLTLFDISECDFLVILQLISFEGKLGNMVRHGRE